MVISSAGYRHLASRTPATIQAGRAQYLTAQEAAAADVAKAPVQVFAQQAEKAFAAATQSGMIDLDTSPHAGGDSPATTPNLLARYLVIREGEEFEFSARATCVLFYVIKGSGRSFQEDEVIEWSAGDVFAFPGGESILNEAPGGDAVLFVVTDEPFVSMTGYSVPSLEDSRCKSTHFVARTIQSRFEDMVAKRDKDLLAARQEAKKRDDTTERSESAESKETGQAVELVEPGGMAAGEQGQTPPAEADEPEILMFASSGFESIGCVAPSFSAGIVMLAGGAQTQPHRHDADTISLCLKCENVHSMIETDRIDWKRNTVILTPAGALHSQHNGGESWMFSFFVQDRGPRPIRTWQPGQSSGTD